MFVVCQSTQGCCSGYLSLQTERETEEKKVSRKNTSCTAIEQPLEGHIRLLNYIVKKSMHYLYFHLNLCFSINRIFLNKKICYTITK